MLILERSALGETAEVASISLFIVFPIDVLLLFFASCVIIEFIDHCFKKLRSSRTISSPTKFEAFLDVSDLLRLAFFSFSMVFLVQEWSGYYNGNNLLTIPVDGTSFHTMVSQFHQNKRQLVVDSFEALFNDNESVIIFGGNSSFIYGTSVIQRFNLTCEKYSRVGLFQEFEYNQFMADRKLNDKCKLTEIKLDAGQHTGVQWLDQTLTHGSPYIFLIAKNGTRRTRERMDYALLTMYSQDNVNNLLMTRSMPIKMLITIEKRKTIIDPQFDYNPMSLTQLQFPLLFFILGLIVGLVGFILEWMHYPPNANNGDSMPREFSSSFTHSMTFSCPTDGIRLAFHAQQAPFYYTDSSGTWRGLSIDYWNDVARMAECDGILLKDYGLKDYSYTLPAAWYKLLFLEKSALGTSAQVASISFFIVFPLDVLLLFYASCKIIDFIEWCFKKCRSRRVLQNSSEAETFLDVSDFIRYAFFSFSIVFIVQQWSGYFNGNNLLSITIDGTPFFTMIAQFHQNKRELVVDSYVPLFNEDEVSLFFGGNSSLIYGNSVAERFTLTCEQSSRVGLFQEYEYFEYLADTKLNEECKLAQITLDAGENTGVGWLNQAMNEGRPYTYLIAKNGTRRMREIMDFALLTVYSYDNVETLLMTRSMPIQMLITIERRKTNSNLQLGFVSMSLTQLQFPLVFLILGLITSLAGFIFEWIKFACNKHCSCCQRIKCCR